MRKLFFLLFLIAAISIQLPAAVLVLNGLTHVHSTKSGSQVNGKIVLKNQSAKPSRIIIYKQDLISSCGKAVEYSTINKHNRSLGEWLKTDVDEKILAPNEEYSLRYSIDIPKANVENGTYWAVFMVEGADPIKEENNNGMQINSKVRYAIQVLADVGGFENPKLAFEDVHFDGKKDSDRAIKIRLKNEGTFSAKTKVSIEIYSEKGEKLKTYEGIQKRIYPNQCNDFEVIIKDLPKGKYEGVLIADSGKDMFGSNITLEIE